MSYTYVTIFILNPSLYIKYLLININFLMFKIKTN